MSITKKIPLKKDTLEQLPAQAAAEREAEKIGRLRKQGYTTADIERQVETWRRVAHQCDPPKVSSADGMAPGSIFTCDEPGCRRQKELIYFSFPNPYADPDDDSSRWAWRTLPSEAEKNLAQFGWQGRGGA